MSIDSSGEIVTTLWAGHLINHCSIYSRNKMVYLLSNAYSLALRLIQPPIQWVLGKFSLNEKWSGHKASH
jgi:hypothetical protein